MATTQPLNYTVLFENAPQATAPAQEVVVTDALDPDLDWRTFRLGEFGWGNFRFQPPANSAFYQDRLDLRESLGFLVDVTAAINVQTGVATWTLTTIDPQTGEKPLDGRIGFLPPDVADAVGQGFVSYRVRPKNSVHTGDVIDALATIVFDTEPPLDTPAIINTIDSGAPTSHVTALETGGARSAGATARAANANDILVKWAGDDDAGGSAVRDFDIFVSDNGGPFTPWFDNTTLAEATYLGEVGHSYAFYSTARDNVGNSEPAPVAADAATSEIRGNVFADSNGNATRDAGETDLAGWTVFVDSDSDGAKDDGEPSAVTNAGGNYVITGLVPGSYTVAEIVQAGFTRTAPVLPGTHGVTIAAGGQVVTGKDFANDGRGPSVLGVQFGGTTTITSIVLTSSERLNPTEAAKLTNFLITTAGKNKKFGDADDGKVTLKPAVYDAAARTVTLTPSKAIKAGTFMRITIGGGGALSDLVGNRFDSNGDGTPNDNFVTTIGRGTSLAYSDSDGDAVSFALKKGGTIELTLAPNGEGLDLRLSGASSTSTLTGTIKPPKLNPTPNNGKTTLRSITGLGVAHSNVTPPKFIVQSISAEIVDRLLAYDQLAGNAGIESLLGAEPSTKGLVARR